MKTGEYQGLYADLKRLHILQNACEEQLCIPRNPKGPKSS